VLVVDDEASVCTFMQHVLESRGYDVRTAHCGRDALEVLETHGEEIRVLVTDVRMPEMNGPTLANAAQKLIPGLAVLYVSGYSDDWDQVPGDMCLQKPFSTVEFVARVQELMAPTGNIALVREHRLASVEG
jgi:two-component system cell cycle sensor histidine kinase/response regulator CckA